ncbi:MAG: metallophosphoesterase [Alphaproteobacteria bacterium]
MGASPPLELPAQPRKIAARADTAHALNFAAWQETRLAMERSGIRRSPRGPISRWKLLLFHSATQVFGVCVRWLGLQPRGVLNARAIELSTVELAWPNLPPAFSGYRILQLSDTHFEALPALAGDARRLLDGLEVDLIVLTGDFRTLTHGSFERDVESLGPLLAAVKSRDGVLAVLGNHDPASIVAALEVLNITVLTNDSIALERGRERVVVTGLDDVHHFYTESARQALIRGSDDFKIALVHSPEVADLAAEAGYALYLCGHTHGGQVCLPGGHPIVTHLTRHRFAAAGRWQFGQMTGYTSRGLGVSRPPVRFNCRGEAALITLRRQSSGETLSGA